MTPTSSATTSNPMDDPLVRYSEERIKQGSKSFAMAARLFSPETRASAYLLYAWCRHCDDVIDNQELGFARDDANTAPASEIVAELYAQTRAAVSGEPHGQVFEGLARVVEQHDIPPHHPIELIDGFAMDASDHHYATFDDTLTYCYHVAGVVGIMMAMIMGVRKKSILMRACDLGLAFQLTNISRDILDDAELGRTYLPADWLREEGLPSPLTHTNSLTQPEQRAALFRVTERMLSEADKYYASAEHGVSQLPYRSAWAIASALSVYRKIGHKVRARGAEAWDTRTIIPKSGKIASLASGAGMAAQSRTRVKTPPPARTGLWTYPGLQ